MLRSLPESFNDYLNANKQGVDQKLTMINHSKRQLAEFWSGIGSHQIHNKIIEQHNKNRQFNIDISAYIENWNSAPKSQARRFIEIEEEKLIEFQQDNPLKEKQSLLKTSELTTELKKIEQINYWNNNNRKDHEYLESNNYANKQGYINYTEQRIPRQYERDLGSSYVRQGRRLYEREGERSREKHHDSNQRWKDHSREREHRLERDRDYSRQYWDKDRYSNRDHQKMRDSYSDYNRNRQSRAYQRDNRYSTSYQNRGQDKNQYYSGVKKSADGKQIPYHFQSENSRDYHFKDKRYD